MLNVGIINRIWNYYFTRYLKSKAFVAVCVVLIFQVLTLSASVIAQPGNYNSPWEEESFLASIDNNSNDFHVADTRDKGNGNGPTSKFCDPSSKQYNPVKCNKHGGTTNVPLDGGAIYVMIGGMAIAIYTIKKKYVQAVTVS